jgi:hypothetical protein
VALDGVWSTVPVLDWLMAQSHLFKDFKVNIRAHPNVPIHRVLSQCVCDKPDNFIISDGTLEEDLEGCFCVLYRQTSVVLQALMNGIPVIHLAIDAPLVADPIKTLEVCKWTVHSSRELQAALHKIKALNPDQKLSAVQSANKYALQYFAPPEPHFERIFYTFETGIEDQFNFGVTSNGTKLESSI